MNQDTQFMFHRLVLPNNMRVLAYPIPTVQSIYVRLDIRNGSIFENEKNNGISHFIEHWIHQGNIKYPRYHQFSSILEEEGIFQNGITYPFGSYYYMKASSLKLDKTMNLLYLLFANPTFPQNRLSHVREVIVNEHNDYWQKPESRFYHDMGMKRFTDQPSYLQDVLGTPATIATITREDTIAWYKRFYHPGNTILTIAGNFKMQDLSQVLKNTFEKLPKSQATSYPTMTKNHYSSFIVHHQLEQRDQITFYISVPAFGWKEQTTKKSLTLDLLTTIIGGGRFSRLFRLLREKNNLVYDVSCGKSLFPYRGTIGIHGYTAKSNLLKTLLLIKKGLRSVALNGFTPKELTIAKNLTNSYDVFKMETPEGIAQHLINQEFWNEKIWSPEKVIKETNSIKLQEVNEMAKELLSTKQFNIGFFGNLSDEETQSAKNIFS